MSLGYDSLLADLYWTRAVQYYGSRAGFADAKFGLLWPLLDIATTLDPKLIVAYRFGAIFLSEPPPAGAGRTDLAIELVKRGIAENPDELEPERRSRLSLLLADEGLPELRGGVSAGEQEPEGAVLVEDNGRSRCGEGRVAGYVADDLVGNLSIHARQESPRSSDGNAARAEGARGRDRAR